MGHLMAELIERHDRERFEVYGVCFSPDDGSEIRSRLFQGFDRFDVVRGETDATAARRIRDLDVDIAIDLGGYAQNARPAILAARPAPIQVSYLGYAGTMGADFIDYIMADPVALPLDEQPFVTEKIVHLPDCSRAYDRSQRSPRRRRAGSRSALRPPRASCSRASNDSFHHHAGDVRDMDAALGPRRRQHIMAAAHPRCRPRERLRPHRGGARRRSLHACCSPRARRAPGISGVTALPTSLSPDTLPFGGHSAVADALWASLPVLTCKGATFPGRVGASMLGAVGLPDLVAPGLAAYEALALRLATEPELLADARRRLEAQRITAPLFDIDRLRRHFEAAYLRMDELRGSGALPTPQSFAIEAQKRGDKSGAKSGDRRRGEGQHGGRAESRNDRRDQEAEPKGRDQKRSRKPSQRPNRRKRSKTEPKARPKEETNAEPGAESKAEPKEDNKAETKAEAK